MPALRAAALLAAWWLLAPGAAAVRRPAGRHEDAACRWHRRLEATLEELRDSPHVAGGVALARLRGVLKAGEDLERHLSTERRAALGSLRADVDLVDRRLAAGDARLALERLRGRIATVQVGLGECSVALGGAAHLLEWVELLEQVLAKRIRPALEADLSCKTALAALEGVLETDRSFAWYTELVTRAGGDCFERHRIGRIPKRTVLHDGLTSFRMGVNVLQGELHGGQAAEARETLGELRLQAAELEGFLAGCEVAARERDGERRRALEKGLGSAPSLADWVSILDAGLGRVRSRLDEGEDETALAVWEGVLWSDEEFLRCSELINLAYGAKLMQAEPQGDSALARASHLALRWLRVQASYLQQRLQAGNVTKSIRQLTNVSQAVAEFRDTAVREADPLPSRVKGRMRAAVQHVMAALRNFTPLA